LSTTILALETVRLLIYAAAVALPTGQPLLYKLTTAWAQFLGAGQTVQTLPLAPQQYGLL
jgi:hypothetical protein